MMIYLNFLKFILTLLHNSATMLSKSNGVTRLLFFVSAEQKQKQIREEKYYEHDTNE